MSAAPYISDVDLNEWEEKYRHVQVVRQLIAEVRRLRLSESRPVPTKRTRLYASAVDVHVSEAERFILDSPQLTGALHIVRATFARDEFSTEDFRKVLQIDLTTTQEILARLQYRGFVVNVQSHGDKRSTWRAEDRKLNYIP